VLATIPESSFDPTRAISTTRTTDRESANAAVGERWSLERAFPGTDGLSSEVPRHGLQTIVTEFRVATRAIEITDRRSEARSTAESAKWRGALRAPAG
jgi:hypothetical protein